MTSSLIVSIDGREGPIEVGNAYFTRRRNAVSTSFRYVDSYLRGKDAYGIDPALGLFRGSQQTSGLPGAFADSAPDRWGRNLITKRMQGEALRDGRTPPSLSDIDFLVGVSDLTRQGALRFQEAPNGPFLDPEQSVPKLLELPRLLQAADAVTREGGDEFDAVKALLEAGSGSLGGARPKASARDGDQLLIAKFPHRNDEWDVMGWEKTALDLAEQAGIAVPSSELLRIDGRSVLLLERFDREGGEQRIGYISAMTLVEGRDGEVRDYTEIAETLPEHGSRPSEDLRELWRRMAFSVAIHNTDDHLRNHGFLRDGTRGWRLAPGFDINPNPNVGDERVTGIGGARTRADELTGLMAYIGTFDLGEQEARRVLREVSDATKDWRSVASGNGVNALELDRFAGAFEGLREAMSSRPAGTGSSGTSDRQPRVPRGTKGGGQFQARHPSGG